MKSVKWMIITAALLLGSIIAQTNKYTTVKNTCSSLGTKPPKVVTDCTGEDPSPGSCCFVTVQMKDGVLRYCTLIPGSFAREKAITDFQDNMPFVTQVNCNSAFLTVSFMLVLLILIFI